MQADFANFLPCSDQNYVKTFEEAHEAENAVGFYRWRSSTLLVYQRVFDKFLDGFLVERV